MYALGVVYWLYQRDIQITENWLANKFQALPEIAKINQQALEAGFLYAQNAGLFNEFVTVPAAKLKKGIYKQVTGNEAISYAAVMASLISQTPLLVAGYPITPASDILHLLSHYRDQGVLTFQAEDEIAAIGAAIGAAFGGQLAMTTTSGPGMDLKSEAMGLAVMAELPLVIVDVQRAGPSTGMPTKVEQSDLLMARFGRHGECPLPILAANSPKDCFDTLLSAFKIATQFMTPVIVLSDGYLANSSEPWEIPQREDCPQIDIQYQTHAENYQPYQRSPETLARHWAIPGTPGCEHRIGGLEKQDGSGNISYDPANHQRMTEIRAQKVQNVAKLYEPLSIYADQSANTLVISWGGTKGEVRTAVERCCQRGIKVAMCHLKHLHPFHADLKALLARFENILVVELNDGQLCQLIRAEFLVPAKSITKVAGQPFQVQELIDRIIEAVPDVVE